MNSEGLLAYGIMISNQIPMIFILFIIIILTA